MDTFWLIMGLAVVIGSIALYFKAYTYLKRRIREKGYNSPLYRATVAGVLSATAVGAIALSPDGGNWSDNANNQEIFFASLPGFLAGFVGPLILVCVVSEVVFYLLSQRGLRTAGIRKVIFPWRAAGVLLLLGGIMFPLVVLWLDRDPWNALVLSFNTFLLGGSYCLYLDRRARAQSLEAALISDPRPPVLYLRAFEGEAEPFVRLSLLQRTRYQPWYAIAFSAGITLEQYLKRQVNADLGPFIALGSPQDYLPPDGAARAYFSDGGWQHEFEVLARQATAIIMAIDVSSNVAWELQAIREFNLQTRLFVLTPPHAATRDNSAQSAQSWPAFAKLLKGKGYEVPAIDPGAGALIAFDAQRKANVLIRNAVTPVAFVQAIAKTVRHHEPYALPKNSISI